MCVGSVLSDSMRAPQAPLSMGFSRQENWSGLSFSPPRDLPDPGIEPVSSVSPALAGVFFTTRATWVLACEQLLPSPYTSTTPFSPLSHPGCSGGEPLPATLSGEGGRSSPEASEFSLLALAMADQTQTKRSQKRIIVMNVQRVGISADEQNTTFFSFVK